MFSSLYNPLNYLFIIVVDSDYNLHYILICFNYLWIFWITFHPYVCFARSRLSALERTSTPLYSWNYFSHVNKWPGASFGLWTSSTPSVNIMAENSICINENGGQIGTMSVQRTLYMHCKHIQNSVVGWQSFAPSYIENEKRMCTHKPLSVWIELEIQNLYNI